MLVSARKESLSLTLCDGEDRDCTKSFGDQNSQGADAGNVKLRQLRSFDLLNEI